MAHFLSLPRELRDQIYAEALHSSHNHIWLTSLTSAKAARHLSSKNFRRCKRNGEPYETRIFPNIALLLTNKQIHHEARHLLIKANHVLLRPFARFPGDEGFQSHIIDMLRGKRSSVVLTVDILQNAHSLTLDPVNVAQLEVMARVLMRRTSKLEELVIAMRRIVYPWDPDDFPETEGKVEDMFKCLEGVRAREVRIEWPVYDCVLHWRTPPIYGSYKGKYGAGWPVPVTDRIAKRLMDAII
jgi:hypothetical protein